ncbi:MAG: serine/threonine protein kinase [Planctomycetales bacterium]|nr:serine/threonine protein kinase [Planctomycetales bacterium]
MFKTRQKVGKYIIQGKLGSGGFSIVYRAMDTVEGIRVALKVPFARHLSSDVLADFRKEVRLVAQLKHPNILALKNADFVDEHFLVAFPLGEGSLADRLRYRISTSLALSYAEQILRAVAYAHENHIIHCDIKPENIILFPEKQLALTDFGIAKISLRTVHGSGSGTLGHMAPEQAMGKPSYRSDVFSIGLILYRMFGGHWPEYPFAWPFPGHRRLKSNLHSDLIEMIQKSLSVNPRARFADASVMLKAFLKAKARAVRLIEANATKSRT